MTTSADAAPDSLAKQAYLALRDRLVLLDIAPGEPLQEARLAEELGVGRTPLREALKHLELDHLVVTYPRRGTFATNVDITALAAITQVRAALEPVAVRAASANQDPAARAALEEAARSLEALEADAGGDAGEGSGPGADGSGSGVDGSGRAEAPDPRRALQVDVGVHRAIYRACGNLYLAEPLLRLDNLSTRIWCVAMHRLPGLTSHVTELRDLLEAILGGDGDRAAELISQHVAEFESSIRSVL
jgi:DNA-binding GntR family transcriptional regulator